MSTTDPWLKVLLIGGKMSIAVPRTLSVRFLLSFFFVVAIVAAPREALASGDYGCSRIWRMVHYNYESCSNMAMLSPGNDTRVNLLLLLADRRPAALGAGIQAKAGNSPLFTWEELAGLRDEQTSYNATSPNDGESKPCTLSKEDEFIAAVQVDQFLTPLERTALLNARTHVQEGCTSEVMAAALVGATRSVSSSEARSYVQYLTGAAKFWQNDDAGAVAVFQPLVSAQSAWVRETSNYMVARALLRLVQGGAFDEYGGMAEKWHADTSRVAAAQAALNRYLQAYPRGRYTKSAQGLKRRSYWLAGDTVHLTDEYSILLSQTPEQRGLSDADLIQEIDNKISTIPSNAGSPLSDLSSSEPQKNTHSPLLLAMLDLVSMRTPERTNTESDLETTGDKTLSLVTLQQQRQYFEGNLPLFELLLATHKFYVEKNPAQALTLLPDNTRQGSYTYLQFSRQTLRGMALEALKNNDALAFWTSMLPASKYPFQRPALELAIAWHHERAGTLAAVFLPGSPVHFNYLRNILLERVAGQELLRAQAANGTVTQDERNKAVFTLLWKEATRGYPTQFLSDLALLPVDTARQQPTTGGTDQADYAVAETPVNVFLHDKVDARTGCQPLRANEALLQKDPSNPTAQLCVADFVRLNQPLGFPPFTTYPDELGDTPSLFPGTEFARMNTYVAVLSNGKSSRADKAYALYRAVECYAPAGSSECGGKDVSKAQRRAWFQTLKRDYADTRWANALKYYW